MEKTLIKYVLQELERHSTATLHDRLEALLDILNAVPEFYWEEVVNAVCKIEEAEDDAPDV